VPEGSRGGYLDGVNPIHNVICASWPWRRRVERELVPWALEDLELGTRVLEIGPGFGATTRSLVRRYRRLDVLEVDRRYCERLQVQFGSRVEVTCGDAAAMPYPDQRFSAVLCFTMLHHIASRELQDRVFSEVARVLAPGGTFAGTDSVGEGTLFKLMHVGDTLLPIDPLQLPVRLESAGLGEIEVRRGDGSFRFRACRPR
jgi:ubiquinone/menaquinone biosynthesis C-methylase UbiE